MKITKEQLLTVSGLQLADVIGGMDNDQFSAYCNALDEFINNFPKKGANLKASLGAKNRDAFSKELLSIMDMLGSIHANELSQGSFKLLTEVRSNDYNTAAMHMDAFLASISALSIDIQIASQKDVKQEEAVEADEEEQSQKSILAVDDVSVLLGTLKIALQNTKFKFTGVTSGKAALKYLGGHKPDLFILDIEMPEMDGYELAKRIKELGHTAPIIFLTGNATTDYVRKAIQAGGSDFIVKPVNKEQVLEKIHKFIG